MDAEAIEALVRERLIAAAATERKLPATGTRPMGYFTTWPIAEASVEPPERGSAWEPAFATFRAPARPREVSAMEEVCSWVAEHVHRPQDRRAVLAWARSKAGGERMKRWCAREGVHHNTGKRRADAAIASIASRLGNDQELLRLAAIDVVVTVEAGSDTERTTLADCDRSAGPAPTAWRDDDAIPRAPHSDEEIAQAERARERHNERMRRRQRRRAAGDGEASTS